MHSKRALQKLLIASAVLFVAQASWLDKSKLEGKEILGRQVAEIIAAVAGTDSATSTTPSAANSPTITPTSTSTPSIPDATTPPPNVVVSPVTSANKPGIVEPSNTPPSSIPITSPPPGAETILPIVSHSQGDSFQWTPTTATTAAPSTFITATPVVFTKVEVITSILSNGSKAIVTTTTKTTSTPDLSSAEGETTGMTSKTRNTVIGVVVGIGGAIVVAALGLVAWRIWGRKKHSEEHDVLMDYDMSSSPGAAEKSERGSSSAGGTQRTPFQSTLEDYHQPSQVNPSSNF
ncbi:hypothetical protein E4U21_006447 [Claviceps maximensis]|nr:hypothetical protein E4U21_006447 [Claviceps maximensis]